MLGCVTFFVYMISTYCLVSGFVVEMKQTKCDRLVYKSDKLGNACVSSLLIMSVP